MRLGAAEARAGARARGLARRRGGSWKGVGVLGTCSALQEGRYHTGLARELEREGKDRPNAPARRTENCESD